MSKFARNLSILIVLVMFGVALAACGTPATEVVVTEPPVVETEKPVETEEPVVTEEPVETEEAPVFEDQPFAENLPTAPTIDTPFVVAYQDFSQKFSPFFGDTAYDMDVSGMTQISIMTTDRVGGIIYNGIEGETQNYNGVDYEYKGAADIAVDYDEDADLTKYTARLRVGMKFSDGEPVTIDDVIFTYYTYLDPTYSGSTSLGSYKILGLKDYQTQTTTEVFEKYDAIFEDIYAAGMDYEVSDSDAWTAEHQAYVWDELKAAGMAEAQSIVSYVDANYRDAYSQDYLGFDPAVVAEDEGLQVALGMVMWGFGEVEDGVLTAPSGATFDLVETFPTVEDYYNEILAAYDNDYRGAFPFESATGTDVALNVKTAFIGYFGPMDESMGEGGVPNIAGIEKIDDYTVEVTVEGYEAPAVYSILGVNITPLHYYGDREKYDYENNMFGFDFGDLSKQQSLTATPMGAGAYKFVEYNNRVVFFEANENYYRGCPKIREIQFRETLSAEVVTALTSGVADAGEMSYNQTRFEEVMEANANGEMTGPVITSSLVDNLGYGYVGINASTVKIGEDPASDASKNLRRALATVLAVYRDVAIDSYYGEGAAVINYPISNTSWAAPQPTDEGYQVAFSVDVDGNPIYTAEMTPEERYVEAEKAAAGFLEAAGYTVVDGVVTEAAEGGKLTYEIIVPGGGTGDHPAFAILTGARDSLSNIGMELKINDPADANILWDALDSGEQELWTAAWGSTIDPDMYQVYHSSNIVGLEGSTESNHYHIQDQELDDLIMEARLSDDQAFRKAIYKQALDRIIDWAVEIPTYQRKNVIIFSTERVNIDSLTPDITTFWGWMNDIELVEMN
ncbi:MAG: ABC transporter substrate-binding protein [Chloroflexi bacterium]|jgi:peptide/nickel transport system substrate-binding protein|nr:ABC transporter substrate-binding protein [Chloroflexota bacterium]